MLRSHNFIFFLKKKNDIPTFNQLFRKVEHKKLVLSPRLLSEFKIVILTDKRREKKGKKEKGLHFASNF